MARRLRVPNPGEKRVDADFYAQVDGTKPVNFSALREAERRFKAKTSDLEADDVVDTRCADRHPRVRRLRTISSPHLRDGDIACYGIDGAEGFIFIPGALDTQQQKHWISLALSRYMQPPNATNLDAHYVLPPNGLWSWYFDGDGCEDAHAITRIPQASDGASRRARPLEETLDHVSIAALIRRIRWAALGQQYNWTTLSYDKSKEVAFPPELAEWAAGTLDACGFPSFTAQAGIVNFYQPGDTLTSHVDRSEPNMAPPLLSLSLGASAIFLLGGRGRDDPVVPLLLHSGDTVILSGPSRSYYHGVPRIGPVCAALQADERDNDVTRAAVTLLGPARININIRQVF